MNKTRDRTLHILQTPDETIRQLAVSDPWERRVLRYMRDEAPAIAPLTARHQVLWKLQLEVAQAFATRRFHGNQPAHEATSGNIQRKA